MARASAALIGASMGTAVCRSVLVFRSVDDGVGVPDVERVYDSAAGDCLARMFEKVETRLEQVFGTDVRQSYARAMGVSPASGSDTPPRQAEIQHDHEHEPTHDTTKEW